MARNQKAYSVNTEKKVITIYTNIKQTEADKMMIDTYIRNGYVLKASEKKTITIAQMRKELKDDENALKEFEALYSKKDIDEDEATGFHQACKFYTNWKKNKKKNK